jgi:hypothetical protein
MPLDLLASLLTAVASLLAAVLTTWISAKTRRLKHRESAEIESIAKALQAEEAVRKSAVLEKAAEKIPAGLTAEQFSVLLNELTLRQPRSMEKEPTQTAVEHLISGYHEQALSQARAQFWFSVVAATVGFAWILYAGTDINAENLASATKILPGVVMDAVAFLFFKQASETRQRATDLYDRLRRDKQMAESVSLVSSIEDVRVRSAVKAQIALHMSGMQPNAIDLSHFLSSAPEASVGPVPKRPND